MKKNQKILLTSLLVSTFLLGGCNSGSGSAGSNDGANDTVNPLVNNVAVDKIIQVSQQLRTPFSANVIEGVRASADNSVSVNKLNIKAVKLAAQAEKCFEVVKQADGKTSTATTNSSQWWSTGQVVFGVKNICSSSQLVSNLQINVTGLKVNGTSVATLGDIGQSGQGPWLTTVSNIAGNVATIIANGPDCSGAYCDWASMKPGAVKTFTINTSLNGKIDSMTVDSVVMDGDSPPPPPPPPVTSKLDVTINTAKLVDVCKDSACSVTLDIMEPSGGKIFDTITVKPSESPNYTVNYSDVLPGVYRVNINGNTTKLPVGAQYSMVPSTGEINVQSNTTNIGQVNYTYTKPVNPSQLSLNIANYKDLAVFSSINTIIAEVTDNTTKEVKHVSLPINGSSVVLNNVKSGDSYTVVTQGVGDAYSGTYYSGANETVTLKDGENTKSINLTRVIGGTHDVLFNVSGLNDEQSTNVIFADNGSINPNFYVYTSNKLENNHTYKFVKDALAAVNVATVSGYTSNINPNVVKPDTNNVNIEFTKQIPPPESGAVYDYTNGYQGPNGATVTVSGGNNFTNPKTAVFKTNFSPTVGGACFTSVWDGNEISTIKDGSYYKTTITAKDATDWSTGKTVPGYLNISLACGLGGGADVVPGVKVANVLALSVDGKNIPIKTLCSTTECKDPGNGKVIAGYYANWSMHSRKYQMTQVPFQNINDLIYAFIDFDENTGDVVSQDTWADENQLPVLSKAAIQYPYLKTSLSFGGWTRRNQSNNFPAVAFYKMTTGDGADTRINNFATQAVNDMRVGGYSGIDIDWEWWSNMDIGTPSDQMINLYTALRNKLDAASTSDGKKYYLTIAVSAGPNVIESSQYHYTGGGDGFWAKVNSLVDHVNVMSYDMHGAFDQYSDFQAPLGNESNSPYTAKNWDINYVINQYHTLGVDYAKLVMGIPAYGRSMYVDSTNNYGLYQDVTGTPAGEFDTTESSGVFDYKCILTKTCHSGSEMIRALTYISSTSNPTIYNEKSSLADQPWGYGTIGDKNYFITYDDVQSTVVKTQRAKALGLGGMMLWELDGDTTDPQTSLISNIKDTLNKP